jgi:hypothetical protein
VGSNASGASLQVEGDAISAVKEASRLLVDLVFAESRKQGSQSLFEWSVRVFNDPKPHGLAKDEAERRMLVHKENYEEAKRIFAANVKSATSRMAALHGQVAKSVEEGGLPGNQNDDDAAAAIQEACTLLHELDLADMKHEDGTMDSEVTDFLKQKRRVFIRNVEWSEARLKQVHRVLESHETRLLLAEGRADPNH